MSTTRLPRIDLSQLLQEQHPHIDLRINIYEESTQNFLRALVGFKNNAITSISERRKHQTAEKKKYTERSQHVEKEVNQCKLKEIDLVAGSLSPIFVLIGIHSRLSQTSNAKRKSEKMLSLLSRRFSVS
jgi:S-methylmethionine-dependent homocysteine/selenocysteine methylase